MTSRLYPVWHPQQLLLSMTPERRMPLWACIHLTQNGRQRGDRPTVARCVSVQTLNRADQRSGWETRLDADAEYIVIHRRKLRYCKWD